MQTAPLGSLLGCLHHSTHKMQVTPDELAEFARLLAKLQGQPSRAEEIDLPAAEYVRVTCVTTTLLVYVCVSMIISICTTGIYGALSQIEFLLWPLCWTALCLLIYGTIDSDAAGRRAVLILRVWSIPLIFIAPTMYWTSGLKGEAALMLFTFVVNAIFFPWLVNATRELLRTRYRGALTARAQHYTNRALKLAGFQIVLLVAAVAQGLDGKETFGRIYATMVFSVTLSLVYIYMTAIFDACGVDASAAAKLRLAPMQAAAVACCGAVTLSGLAGYVVAEQRRPSKQAATVVVFTMLPCNYLSMVFVGRLVWVARRKAPDDSAASVQPVKDESLEAGGVFDVPGA